MTSTNARESALATAHELSRASQRQIGSNLVAVILHGSLVADDFIASKSDIDLLVIVGRPLAEQQKTSLASAVTSLARGCWIDYRVVTSDVAKRPSTSPTLDFSVGMHPGLPQGVEIEHGPVVEADLLFEFAICRQDGRSLIGSEPSALIGAIPEDWLLELGDAYLKRWQEVDYDDRVAELMVLTACRLWFRSAEHRQCTKSAAAHWVMRQAPELAAPELALQSREGDAAPTVAEADVMTLLTRVREVLAARHGPGQGGIDR